MKAFEVVKILKKNGWHEVHCVGSHHVFKHKDHPEKRIPFAYHRETEEIPKNKIRKMEKQFGIKILP